MSRGSNGREVFFGLEFTHAKDPDAVVFKTTRRGQLTKWVDEYKPIAVTLPSGSKTMRERVGVQCPRGFMLRKDEIHQNMKQHDTENWQNGKFFTVMDHVVAKSRHKDAELLLKKQLIENKPEEVKDGDKSGTTGNQGPIVAGEDSPKGNPDGVVVDGSK